MSPNAFKPKVAWTNTWKNYNVENPGVDVQACSCPTGTCAQQSSPSVSQCTRSVQRLQQGKKASDQIVTQQWSPFQTYNLRASRGQKLLLNCVCKGAHESQSVPIWMISQWLVCCNENKRAVMVLCTIPGTIFWLGTVHQHHVQMSENCAYCGFWKSSLRRQSLPSQHQFASPPECNAGFGLRAHTVTTPASHHSSQDTDQCLRFPKSFVTARIACAYVKPRRPSTAVAEIGTEDRTPRAPSASQFPPFFGNGNSCPALGRRWDSGHVQFLRPHWLQQGTLDIQRPNENAPQKWNHYKAVS